jgi:periplasmic divalent cation tolerance protein
MRLLAVHTTVADLEDAHAIARSLVERRLAACAQIEPIESVYVWKGDVQQEREFRIVVKTTAARYGAVEAAIRALHPYELPAIYALPTEHAFAPYAAWVEENSGGG